MWGINDVFTHDILKPISKKTFTQLNITLDPDDEDSWIKDVRTGKNPDFVVVIVNQNELVDTIFIWDI